MINITMAPYYAVGDGLAMNTAALQRAIDDVMRTVLFISQHECILRVH